MGSPRAELVPLHDPRVPVQLRLAAAWTCLLLLYVYVDIVGLYMPGVVDDILAGIVWELDINQTWALGALMLMAVPILMVVLSTTLPARVNRTTNLIVASAYVPVSLGNAVGEAWAYFFGLAVGLQVGVLAVIIRSAWTWPRMSSPADPTHEFARPRRT